MGPILLVEDDENDIFFFRKAAGIAGIQHPVHVIKNGEQAIDYLAEIISHPRNQQNLPSLIFLDLKLPQKTGLEVLEWIRQQPHLRFIVVIVMSSSEANADVEKAYLFGANSYLLKQGDPETLIDILRSVNRFWLHANLIPHATELTV